MTVEELLVYGKSKIHSMHSKMLLAELMHKNALELYNILDYVVDDETSEKYKKMVDAVEAGKPLQYVIGNVNFYGNIFNINENVLIPRFETEELVDYTVRCSHNRFNEPVDLIDLGCGSGVIGLTLEKMLSTNSVDLVDISEEALKVACGNRDNLGLHANLIHSDMWKNVPADKKYDIVVSNPPYIKTNEEIEDIVKNNEPHLALYAGDDGLDCYRKIFEGIKPHLKENFLITLEIGYTQAEDIKNIANTYLDNINIYVRQDGSLKDRFIIIMNK